MMKEYIDISPEVKKAIANNKPVIALESTIISHGMPYPENVETALKAESIITENGGVPATIAIIKGKIKVGLSKEEIDYIGKQGVNVVKASRRDIPYIVSKGVDGATTVSATMFIASLANIKVFATGGIGGVHRGASDTFDISTDLEELAQTNVAVVCAGAKSILDLEKTLEYLETKGVPVIGYKTDFLPAFYTSTSPYKLSLRLDSPEEIANLLKCKWDIGLNGGVVIANPIPKEFEVEEKLINKAIDDAIIEMERKNIIGKDTTPFLLGKIVEITEGKSLKANIELVYNNCKLATEVAKLL
ncbi:MAG TPA: pseudouridine-5'-phosphate glycosidase [Acholeplasmataceae bacterium]|nr:pseudouridine-5'-phosphate glycosidase [Acholeplasmataceae bacterium]